MPRAQALAQTGVAGVGLFVVSVLVLHVVQSDLSPRDMAVSYYLNGRFGWILGLGLVSLGVGSISLAAALRTQVAPSRAGAGFWLLVVWGLGAIVGGLFPPDPPGHWDQPPSLAGLIHGVAAMVAFLAFPIAACLISRRLPARCDSSVARLLFPLAVSCAVALVVFFVCLFPVFSNRPPYALGLIERVLLALYAGWLVALGVSVRRAVVGG